MTVGIIDHVYVEKQLLAFAKQQGNAMLGVVTYATAYTLSQSAKSVKFLRGRMEDQGCPKGTIDRCFAIAKVLAPSIEDAVKVASTAEDALVEVQAQVERAKGDLTWKAFENKLKGKDDSKALQLPPIRSDFAPGVLKFLESESVPAEEMVQPLSSVEQTLFDKCMLALPNWSAEQRGAIFQAMLQMSDLDTLAAMGSAIVAETEVAMTEELAKAS